MTEPTATATVSPLTLADCLANLAKSRLDLGITDAYWHAANGNRAMIALETIDGQRWHVEVSRQAPITGAAPFVEIADPFA